MTEFKQDIISSIRRDHSLSQEQLAHFLGVAYSSVNAWESGKRIPQPKMQEILIGLSKKRTLPTVSPGIIQPEEPFGNIRVGINRSDAGYISSIIDYQGRRDPGELTHAIGRWYGSLPSFLVRDLVRFVATDFDVSGPALVNFAGGGTVAVELGLARIRSTAIDVNPYSVLLNLVKTQPFCCEDIEDCKHAINRIKKLGGNKLPPHSLQNSSAKNLIINENRWLDEQTRSLLYRAIGIINDVEDKWLQLILATGLLNIVIDYCQIDKRCTNHYVFKDRDIAHQDLSVDIESEVKAIISALRKLEETKRYVIPEIMIGDAKSLCFDDESFEFVFSHPPYSNSINYFATSRIQLSILELLKLKHELWPGSLPSNLLSFVQDNDMSSGTQHRYDIFTSQWIAEAARVMKSRGVLLVIIGDTRASGALRHPHTLVIQEAEDSGLTLKELFVWKTQHKSGMHVRRKGHHIDHNYILMFQKL